jgi:phosphoserine phosphatase
MTAAPPFRSVWFDCDSTLSRLEGIDELARLRPQIAAEVVALTAAAMDGGRPLEDVYGARLRLIAPSRAEVDALGQRYVAEMVVGAREVVATLRRAGKVVGIVSGGLLPPVRALARALGVDEQHVHAVDVRFDAGGRYLDFDRASPLVRAGGKRELMEAVARQLRPCAFVGDGVTDLDTQGTADLFVGFGGVVRREKVAAVAEAFVADSDLRAVLPLLLTGAERAAAAGTAGSR